MLISIFEQEVRWIQSILHNGIDKGIHFILSLIIVMSDLLTLRIMWNLDKVFLVCIDTRNPFLALEWCPQGVMFCAGKRWKEVDLTCVAMQREKTARRATGPRGLAELSNIGHGSDSVPSLKFVFQIFIQFQTSNGSSLQHCKLGYESISSSQNTRILAETFHDWLGL